MKVQGGQEVQLTHSAAGMVFIYWPLSDHRLEVLELISTFFNVPAGFSPQANSLSLFTSICDLQGYRPQP